AGMALGGTVAARLLIGWSFGTLVSVVGMAASAVLDLPTGATVVCTFGLTLLACAIAARLFGWRSLREKPVLAAGALRSAETRWPVRRGVLLAGMFLLGGCASLSPAVAIPNTQTLAGAWRGRVSGFAGNAMAVMTIAETGAYTGTMFLEVGDTPFQ